MDVNKFVAEQIKSAAPNGQWHSGGVDRADELAQIFVHNGIVDLTKLRIRALSPFEAMARRGANYTQADFDRFNAPATQIKKYIGNPFRNDGTYEYIWEPSGTWRECNIEDGRDAMFSQSFASNSLCSAVNWNNPGPITPVDFLERKKILPYVLEYEGKLFGYLGDANNDGSVSNSQPIFQIHPAGPMVAWSARGDGGCSYVLMFNQNGFAFVPFWGSTSDLPDIKEFVMVAASFVVMAFTLNPQAVSLSTTVGSAIVGPQFAAAYPGVTAAIGQTAVGTALSGGDIERAVQNTLAAYAGSIAGNYLTGLTDSAIVGKMAAVAVNAELTGGDPAQAVQIAALQFGIETGVRAVEDFYNSLTVEPVESYDPFGVNSAPVSYDFPVSDFGAPTTFESMPYAADMLTPQSTTIYDPTIFNPVPAPVDPFVYTYGDLSTVTNPFSIDPLATATVDFSTVSQPTIYTGLPDTQPAPVPMQSGTTGWDFAIAALKMLPQFINQPTPLPAPAPRVSVTPTGSVDPRMLPPQTPVSGPDGRIYVNNGNGSYTVIDSQGRTATMPMPGGSTSGFDMGEFFSNPTNIAIAAVAAFFLLRK